MAHLTNSQVGTYWSRQLAPADLLWFDSHVAECPQCREALMAAAPPANFLSDAMHLEYEQIEDYVKGTGPADARTVLEEHVAHCEACRAEVEDLSGFRAEYRPLEPAQRTAGERWFGLRSPWLPWRSSGH